MSQDLRHSLKQWSDFLGGVRAFFAQEHILEVQTPTLVVSPGSEPFLDFFTTQKIVGSRCQSLYLPASPELSLKKLVAQGAGSIFEMRACFRNNEDSERHRCEFFMLEWYSVGAQFSDLKTQVWRFIQATYAQCESPAFALPKGIETWSIAELFRQCYQFELQPQTSAKELFDLAQQQGLQVADDWSFDDLFHLLMITRVEPFLATKSLALVELYPPSQAALAKLNANGWALRFELYASGVELANAYEELCDLSIQQARFEADNQLRVQLGRAPVPHDPDFWKAYGQFPDPFCGIAFGLERWFMLLRGHSSIHQWSPLFPPKLVP